MQRAIWSVLQSVCVASVPLYGYKIVDGRAVVDKPAQKKIQLLFQNYLAGMSLSKAAEKAGIHIPHGMVAKLLSNQHYLGDSFYPQLIDKSTFEKQQWHEGIAQKSWGGQT